jgi:hypothetical protein
LNEKNTPAVVAYRQKSSFYTALRWKRTVWNDDNEGTSELRGGIVIIPPKKVNSYGASFSIHPQNMPVLSLDPGAMEEQNQGRTECISSNFMNIGALLWTYAKHYRGGSWISSSRRWITVESLVVDSRNIK